LTIKQLKRREEDEIRKGTIIVEEDAPVQEICGDAVRGDNIGRSFHERVPAVGGEDYGGRH
jgi:hypothetical protein